MKWLWIALPVMSLCLAVPCQAQNRAESKPSIGVSPGELTPTQDMWFYEQYQKQYTDPKVAVRQQAEFRSVERQRRIAALRWFGFSNQRPTALTGGSRGLEWGWLGQTRQLPRIH